MSRQSGSALDTTVDFPPGADSLVLQLLVPIKGASETLTLDLRMINAAGDTVFRGGPIPVTATVAAVGPPASVPVPIRYTGVGSNARSVRIAPRAAAVFFRDSVRLAATALDSAGKPIPGTPIFWRSLDTLVASVPVDSSGKVMARTMRGVARVEAMLPTNQTDTALVTVQPVPAFLSLVSGVGQTGTVGAALAQPLDVRVKAADSLGVQGVVVNFAVTQGGGSVSKTSDTTNASGDAPTVWTLGSVVGPEQVTATVAGAPGLTAIIAATGVAGPAKKLAFQVQPSNVAAGVAIVPSVEVVAQDTFGNIASGFGGNVTLAIGANPGGATLGGTLTVAAVAGVATFGNLSLNVQGTGYTLAASGTGLAGATSAAFNVVGSVPTQLAFVQQPTSATAGTTIAPAITVAIRDVNGNAVTTATNAVTLAIGNNAGGGTLSGTATVNAVAGIATFSNLRIDKTGTGYTLGASATGLTSATSTGFNITPAPANQLAFTTQPVNTTAGTSFGVVVTAHDSLGNTATGFGGTVTLALVGGPANAHLRGTLSAVAGSGVASFSGLSIDSVATGYTVTASATGAASATSTAFNIVVAPASRLVFTTQPVSTTAGTSFGVVVTAHDSLGNTATGFGGTVTLALVGGSANAHLRGTLSAVAGSGAASFSGLSVDSVGTGYTLTATSSPLTAATSSPFNIVVAPASRLVFTTQPVSTTAGTSFGVVVTAHDSLGNAATGFGGTVTLALVGGPANAHLRGTLSAVAGSGAASFSGLSVDSVGTGYTLTASATGLTSGTSTAFAITAAPASRLVFTTEPPASTTAGTGFALAVTARDSLGNTASAFTGGVTVAITGGTGTAGAHLLGTASVAAVVGVATFSGLSVDSVGTGYTLTASATGPTSGTSTAFNIVPGVAASLTFSAQPPASSAYQTPFAFTVTAKDAGGNRATGFTGPVTVAIAANPASGTLSGTLSQNAVGGVATFTGVSIDNIGVGYTVSASAASVTSSTSAAFNIVAPANVNAWVNTAGGNWSLASNWSKGAVPLSTDTVAIKQSGTYTVNLDVNATFARLDVGAPLGAQTLSVAANTLTAGNGAFSTRGTLALSGTGAIAGAGTLDIAGAFNWLGGNLGANGGTTRVLAGGTLSLAPAATVNFQNHTLEVAGTGTWTGTATIQSGSGAVLRVASGGTLTIQGDPTFAYNLGGATSALNVAGTLTRTTSLNVATVTAALNDSGTVSVTSGTLRLGGGGTSSGAYSAATGATLDFNAGTHALAAASSVGGAGTVSFSGGIANLGGGHTVTGLTLVSGGTANFNGASGSTGALTVSSGTLGGSGLLTVSGAMSWTGGNLVGAAGTTRVLASGTLSLAPAATVNFQNHTLEVAGTGTWTGTATIQSGSGAVLRVASGGTLTIQGDPTFAYNLGGATSALNVVGTLTRTTSLNVATVTAALNDSGTVSVTSGTLRLAGGGTSSGAYTAGTGTTLDFNAGTHTLAATSSVGGAGTVSFSGGITNLAGGYAVTSPTLINGGTANFNGASGSTGALTVSSGTLGGSGLLTVSGAMSWTGGNLVGAAGTTRVLASGTLGLAPAATVNFQSYTLEVAGTGTWTGTAQVNSGSAAVLRVASGGTLTIQGDPTFAFNLGGATSLLENLGTITRTTSSGIVTVSAPFNLGGSVSIQTGAISVNGGGTMTGAVTLANATALQFTSGSTTLANGFKVTGASGVTQISGGTVGGLAATDTAFFDNLQLLGGTLSLAGGTIKTPLSTSWTGPTAISGGTLFVPVGGALTVGLASTANFQNATILNAGTAVWSGTATLNSGSGALIRNMPGASFAFSAAGTYAYNLGGATSVFDNQGTLTSAPGVSTFTITGQFNNSGLLKVASGVLSLSGGGTQTARDSITTGAFLDFAGGTHTLNNGFIEGGAGQARLQSGILATATAADTARFSKLQLNGGSLSQPGGVIADSLLDWAGGAAITGAGTTRVLASGKLTLTGTATRNFQNGVLENRGAGTWGASLTINAGSGSIIRNAAGATFTLSGVGVYAWNLGGVQSLFDNLGTFVASPTGTVTWSAAFSSLSPASFSVTTGTFQLSGGGRFGGSPSITTPGVLEITAGSDTLRTGANVTGTGLLKVSGGTLTVDSAGAASVTNLAVTTSGSLNHKATLTATSLQWSGGSIGSNSGAGSGITRVALGGALTISGTSTLTFNGPHTIDLQGAATFSGTNVINSGGGAVIQNAATFDWQGDGQLLWNLGGTQTLFHNNAGGVLQRSTSVNAAVLGAQLDENGGTINVTTGTLRLTGGSGTNFGGSAAVASGDTLDLAGGTWTLSGNLTVTGSGTVRVSAGSLVPNTRKATLGGNFSTSGSGVVSMVNALDSLLVTGNATFSGGTSVLSAGGVKVAGNFSQSTTSTAFNSTGTTVILNGALLQTITMANPTSSLFRRIEVNKSAGSVNLASDVRLTGTFRVASATSITGPTARLVVADSIKSPTTLSSITPLVVEVGTWLASDSGAFSPDTAVFTAPNFTIPNGIFTPYVYKSIRVAADTVSVIGTISAANDVVIGGLPNVSATLAIGGTSTLTVNGNLRTEGNGKLKTQISGSTINVIGNATFAGASTAGLLTAGQLFIAGNFAQTSGTSASSFAPSGAHVTLLNGSTNTTASFQSPTTSFFDSLMVDRGFGAFSTLNLLSDVLVNRGMTIQNSSNLTGATAHLKIAAGTLHAPQSTTSPTITSLSSLEMTVAPVIGPSIVNVSPDTVIYSGNLSIGTSSGLNYQSLRISAHDTLPTAAAGLTLTKDFVVDGTSATFDVGPSTVTLTIGGNLVTRNSGRFNMTQATEQVNVAGNATFGGSNPSGSLTAGGLHVKGNFTQTTSATSFVATGTHLTDLNGSPGTASTQTVSFSNPDSTAAASHFANLQISDIDSGGVTLATPAFAVGQLQTPFGPPFRRIYSPTNQRLVAFGANVDSLILDGVPLQIDNGTITGFNNSRFRNFPGTATQLTVRQAAGAATLNNLVFPVTNPTTGFYIATQLVGSGSFTLTLFNPTPIGSANGGKISQGAFTTITWP